MFMVN